MIWKLKKAGITITAELHDKISKSSSPINMIQSEIVGVRSMSKNDPKKKKRVSESEMKFRS